MLLQIVTFCCCSLSRPHFVVVKFKVQDSVKVELLVFFSIVPIAYYFYYFYYALLKRLLEDENIAPRFPFNHKPNKKKANVFPSTIFGFFL